MSGLVAKPACPGRVQLTVWWAAWHVCCVLMLLNILSFSGECIFLKSCVGEKRLLRRGLECKARDMERIRNWGHKEHGLRLSTLVVFKGKGKSHI